MIFLNYLNLFIIFKYPISLRDMTSNNELIEEALSEANLEHEIILLDALKRC